VANGSFLALALSRLGDVLFLERPYVYSGRSFLRKYQPMSTKAETGHVCNEDMRTKALEILLNGGLVALPTDTVYGLAALPWDIDAVTRLYEAKQRPADKAIPLLLSDADQIGPVTTLFARLETCVRELISRFWPGGLTLILPKSPKVPDVISTTPTVALRVPDHNLTRDIIAQSGGALAVTSANISGQLAPITAQEVEKQLGKRIDFILDGGPSKGGMPSTILDCTDLPPTLLRRGAISEKDLRAVIGPIIGTKKS